MAKHEGDRRKGPRPVVVEVYRKGVTPPFRYRWRLLAGNGTTIADGSEGYSRERDAVRAAKKAVMLLRSPLILTCSRRGLPIRERPADAKATRWARTSGYW